MLCATISLPLPLSPVTSTFASDRATRSISARRATMAGLWPKSRTWALGGIVNDVWPMVSSVGKAYDYLSIFLTEVHEARADPISGSPLPRHDAADLHFGRKRLPPEIEPKASPAPLLLILARQDQDAGLTDVEQLN